MSDAHSAAVDWMNTESWLGSANSRFYVHHAWLPLALFGVALTLLHLSAADLWIAQHLYVWEGGKWGLRDAWITEGLLHRGGRALFYVLWLGTFTAWLIARQRGEWQLYREPLKRLLLATLLSVGAVAWIKSWSGVDCPWDLREFGGGEPLRSLFSQAGSGRSGCFPAAHAGSGYAWLATYFFLRSIRPAWRWYGMAFGIVLGLVFGIAQQLRGAHFLSHDLWSAALCWSSALIVEWSSSRRSIEARSVAGEQMVAPDNWLRSHKLRLGVWGNRAAVFLRRRPVVSQERLALMVAIFFTAFCNRPFFAAVAETYAFAASGGVLLALSMFAAVTAINTFLICLFLTHWTTKPVLSLLLVVTALATYYMLSYGVYLDTQMILNILHTDSKESFELISARMMLTIAALGVLPTIFVWRVRLVRRTWGRAMVIRVATLSLSLLVAAAAVGFSFQNLSALMRNYPAMRHLVTPANYIVSLTRVAWGEQKDKGLPRLPMGEDAQVVGKPFNAKPRLLVLVIGETVRAQNWGLNGYTRQTTPQLAALPVINFSDVTACGTSTEVSLPCMLSPFGRSDYDARKIKRSESLLHVLNHAGIHTEWLDNQTGCKGTCEGLPFESYETGKKGKGCDDEGCLDEAMLAGLLARINKQVGDQVIVLHPLGNHGPAYYQRYPAAFEIFTPACRTAELGSCDAQSIVNAYDNAILYTDDFLTRIITLLEQRADRDTAMIYVSDHGESLGERGLFLHGVPYVVAPDTQTKVPMLLWTSDALATSRRIDQRCLMAKAAQPASHDNLFHSVLGLLQVHTSAYRPELDLFEGCDGSVNTAWQME